MQSHRLSSSPVHTYHHRSNSVASMSLPHLSAGITPSDNHSYGDVRTLPFPPAPKLIAPSPTGSDSSERNTDILSYLGIDQSAHHRLSDPNHALARENRSCMASTNNGEWTPSPDQRVYPPLGERKERKVQHDYTDYSPIVDPALAEDKPRVGRGGVVVPFPEKLHNMLEAADIEGFHEIVSWQPHGRAFCVHKPQRFVERIMRSHFRQTKLTSFQRQLNLYGFRRITKGKDSGAYYHEMFMRSRPDLCRNMLRIKVKGTGSKAANNPDNEPNFYAMQPITVSHSARPGESRCGTFGSRDLRNMLTRPSKSVQPNRTNPMADAREFSRETAPFVSNQDDYFCNLLNTSLRTGGASVDTHLSSETVFVTPTNQGVNIASLMPHNINSHRRSRSSVSSNALDQFLGMPGLTDVRSGKSNQNISHVENEDTLDGFFLEL